MLIWSGGTLVSGAQWLWVLVGVPGWPVLCGVRLHRLSGPIKSLGSELLNAPWLAHCGLMQAAPLEPHQFLKAVWDLNLVVTQFT